VEYAGLCHKKKKEVENVISANLGPNTTILPFCYGADNMSATRLMHIYLGNYGSIWLSKWAQPECFTIYTALGRKSLFLYNQAKEKSLTLVLGCNKILYCER
jgi:hypothetical protein